VCQTCGK
jgi:hypothetical protein